MLKLIYNTGKEKYWKVLISLVIVDLSLLKEMCKVLPLQHISRNL